jgi:hypothetical protein
MPGAATRRRKLIARGGARVGPSGTDITEIVFGTVTACTPAVSASGDMGTGSMSISALDAGAKIILMPMNAVDGLMVYAASVTAAGTVSASFCSAIGEALSASETMQFQYVAFV